MTRAVCVLSAALLGGAASAQVVGGPGAGGGFGGPMAGFGGAFGPNVFNRGQQPLSPYLNLLNGVGGVGSPAVNYFYGVRPGLAPGVANPGGVFGFQGSPLGPPGTGNRFYLQPPTGLDELPYQPFEAAQPLPVIPTAAHTVTFRAAPGYGGPGFRPPVRAGFGAQQPAAPRANQAPRR